MPSQTAVKPKSEATKPPASEVYTGHIKKIKGMDARRKYPFDEKRIPANIDKIDTLVDIIAGKMQLPGPLEGRMLMTLASGWQQQKGSGVMMIKEEPWMLLDVVLIARHRDPQVPACLVAEMMLKAQVASTIINEKEMTIAQVFASEYDQWSKIPNADFTAENHFKFGYALLMEGQKAVSHALDQLAIAATHPDHTADSADLMQKVLTAAPGEEATSAASGAKYAIDLEAEHNVLVDGKPAGAVKPAIPAGTYDAVAEGPAKKAKDEKDATDKE